MTTKTLYAENGLVYELADESLKNKISDLHKNTFPPEDNIAMQFGDAFVKKTYEWFLKSEKAFVIVAKDEITGELAGVTAFSLIPYSTQILKYGFFEALLGILKKPRLLMNNELQTRLKKSLWGSEEIGLNTNSCAQFAFTMVGPNFRRKGVGTQLRLQAIKVLKSFGATSVITGIKQQNKKAIALNEKMGFKEVAELRTKTSQTMKLDLYEYLDGKR